MIHLAGRALCGLRCGGCDHHQEAALDHCRRNERCMLRSVTPVPGSQACLPVINSSCGLLLSNSPGLETTAPDVWAIGECAGSPQFTHVSFDDFRIIRDNLAGGNRSTRDRLVPYCLFTDPPLARVGLSEGEARQRGIAVRVANLPMSAVLRTRTIGETAGFMKVLVEARGDRILGFTMIGLSRTRLWPRG